MYFNMTACTCVMFVFTCVQVRCHGFRMQSVQNLGLAVISLVAGKIVDAHGYFILEVFFMIWLCCEYQVIRSKPVDVVTSGHVSKVINSCVLHCWNYVNLLSFSCFHHIYIDHLPICPHFKRLQFFHISGCCCPHFTCV